MPEDAPVQDIDPMLDDTADQLIEAMRERNRQELEKSRATLRANIEELDGIPSRASMVLSSLPSQGSGSGSDAYMTGPDDAHMTGPDDVEMEDVSRAASAAASKKEKKEDKPKTTLKQEGGTSSRLKKVTIAPSVTKGPTKEFSDISSGGDDVELTNVTLNRSKDMEFWKSQSPNEIRAQLSLRSPMLRQLHGGKTKPLLLQLIETMMRDGSW